METQMDKSSVKLENQAENGKAMSEINEIVREHESPLLRYAARILHDGEGAKDVVQEAFIRYLRISQNEASAEIENVKAWLYKVTRNICLDHLKSKKMKIEMPFDENIANFASAERQPDSSLELEDEMRLVRKAIMKLEARDREIVILKIEHNRSYKDISDIMNLSVTNIGFILHTSMKKIASELKSSSGGRQVGS